MPEKDLQGFYEYKDIKKLSDKNIIKLMIEESSYQETINMVRDTLKIYKDKQIEKTI